MVAANSTAPPVVASTLLTNSDSRAPVIPSRFASALLLVQVRATVYLCAQVLASSDLTGIIISAGTPGTRIYADTKIKKEASGVHMYAETFKLDDLSDEFPAFVTYEVPRFCTSLEPPDATCPC